MSEPAAIASIHLADKATVVSASDSVAVPGLRNAKTLRVGLFGLFGCGNFGNDGSLQAVLEMLRRDMPDAELTCVCFNPDLVSTTFDIKAVAINWSRCLNRLRNPIVRRFLKIAAKLIDIFHALAHARRFDIVIIPGTGILDDFGDRPWGMPYDLFRWCLAVRLSGAKLAMLSIGAGPIRNPHNRSLIKAAAWLASYRSYRDHISKSFVQSIGLETSMDQVYPDIVFMLATPPDRERPGTPSGALTVGVGIMSYYGWHAFGGAGERTYSTYVANISEFVMYLTSNGHAVRLITGEDTDERAVKDVLARVGSFPSNRGVDLVSAARAESLNDLMMEIASTDVIVATRFHNIVCSLKMGRPTISLGYAMKNDALMSEVGLQDFCQQIENFDLDLLIEQFENLVSHRADHEGRIRVEVGAFVERLAEQGRALQALVST